MVSVGKLLLWKRMNTLQEVLVRDTFGVQCHGDDFGDKLRIIKSVYGLRCCQILGDEVRDVSQRVWTETHKPVQPV